MFDHDDDQDPAFEFDAISSCYIFSGSRGRDLCTTIAALISDEYTSSDNQLSMVILRRNWNIIKKDACSQTPSHTLMKPFWESIQVILNKDIREFETFKQQGLVRFQDLKHYFYPGLGVAFEQAQLPVAAKVFQALFKTSPKWRRKCLDENEEDDDNDLVSKSLKAASKTSVDKFDKNSQFNISYQFYFSDGTKYRVQTMVETVDFYEGGKSLDSFHIKMLNEEQMQEFQALGVKSAQWTIGVHFVHYHGSMYDKCGNNNKTATGRIIIDHELAMNQEDDEYSSLVSFARFTNIEESIPEQDQWMIFPFVLGYSLAQKRWGVFFVGKCSDIVFRDESFNHLVLDSELKTTIQRVVTFGTQQRQKWLDLVDGKSGGLIFLLHGPPGVGKSITAETTAELLHCPLLSLTAGELGVFPDDVEKHLQDSLKRAQRWKAIVLIDEADVFMVQRSHEELERNAIVSIFLRCLEYFDGVLFLTTNRISSIDHAIRSRMSMIVEYESLSSDKRFKIWQDQLALNNISSLSHEQIHQLSLHDCNGRQIKHAVRMSIASSIDQTPTLQDIERVLRYL